MAASPSNQEPAPDSPTEVIPTDEDTASGPAEGAPAAPAVAAPRISRPVLAALIGLAAAVLIAVLVIVALVIPKGGTTLADAPAATNSPVVPSPSATSRPSSTPPAGPTPTKTPDAAPPAPAPAPGPVDPVPAPVDPVPAPVQPPLPEPPPPVIPAPTITSMDTYYSGVCTTSTTIYVAWTSNNGDSATMNVRSGGGTPVFNQNWTNMQANGNQSFSLDCTRPVWFFTLTVTNAAGSKKGLLTFANGSNQGWSSN